MREKPILQWVSFVQIWLAGGTSFERNGSRADSGESPSSRLTARQLEITQLLAEGRTTKEVAAFLGISLKTAETHRSNLMHRLHCRSAAELVRFAVRNQIIEA